MKTIAALLFALALPVSAHAQIFPGEKISTWAASYVKNTMGEAELGQKAEAMSFIAYVIGIAEAQQAAGKICMPEHTNGGQIAEVANNYLRSNPDRWHEPAFELISGAFADAYKCKKKSKR